MPAAGLIDRTPDPEPLCLFGRMITGQEPNADGATLPSDDADWLTTQFHAHPKRGRRTWLGAKLEAAGFAFSHYTLDHHLKGTGRCACPDGTVLRGANA